MWFESCKLFHCVIWRSLLGSERSLGIFFFGETLQCRCFFLKKCWLIDIIWNFVSFCNADQNNNKQKVKIRSKQCAHVWHQTHRKTILWENVRNMFEPETRPSTSWDKLKHLSSFCHETIVHLSICCLSKIPDSRFQVALLSRLRNEIRGWLYMLHNEQGISAEYLFYTSFCTAPM